MREPVPRAQYVARLIEAVPEDWSDVTGHLESTTLEAVLGTGYDFHLHERGVRVAARLDPSSGPAQASQAARPDLAALLVEGRPPGFVSFRCAGYGARWQFLDARTLAAGFVRRGYRGWVSLNNGRCREHTDEVPARVEVHLDPWVHRGLLGQGSLLEVGAPARTSPPVVVLSWDPRYGGSLTQLEPVHAICRRALQEWVVPLEGQAQDEVTRGRG